MFALGAATNTEAADSGGLITSKFPKAIRAGGSAGVFISGRDGTSTDTVHRP
jgi:hypothetical protein